MGSRVAVYDLTIPAEGALSDRKIVRSSRGGNRRGRRSRRGGRKRRAVVSEAPDSSRSSVASKSPNLNRLEKRELKVKAVLAKQVKVAKLCHQLIPVLKNSGRYDDSLRTWSRYCGCQKTWIRIQSGRAYGTPTIWKNRWEISVHGIDIGSQRAGITAPPWVVESDGQKVFRKGKPVSLEVATGYYCDRCQRSTNMTVCRNCGQGLVAPARRKGRPSTKPGKYRICDQGHGIGADESHCRWCEPFPIRERERKR